MTTVGCDLSHVASIGDDAFRDCTSLLPPSLSAWKADPAAVLACLKRQHWLECAPLRYAIYASALVARKQEHLPRSRLSPTPLAFRIAKLPPDMVRVIIEFAHGTAHRSQLLVNIPPAELVPKCGPPRLRHLAEAFVLLLTINFFMFDLLVWCGVPQTRTP
jgi:hypothetical protein